MPKVLIDGQYVDVTLDQIQDDTGNPFVPPAPPGQTFTAEDIARARSEEKDKLYSRLEQNSTELTALREQIGSLTAAEQRRQAQLEEEQKRLEEEARRQEEQGLDAATLIERKSAEWQQTLAQKEQEWNARWEQSEQQRLAAEALAEREREFGNLKDYAQSQVAANQDKIAPQLLPWITGNSQEEIDAAIQRAITTTDSIAEEMQQAFGQQQVDPNQQQFAIVPGQQPVPPVLPGTRATGGPANVDPAGSGQQTLTADQIANMPMDQYAKLRGQLGVARQNNNRGLFG